MAVFRVEKKKDFTVMSNHHLRNGKLSLKARGLLLLWATRNYWRNDMKEEVEAIEETLVTIGKRNSCQIEAHYLKQREALNTALPIGVRQVETMRTLMTQSLAVLMPFNVQELYLPGKGGTYYGVNQVSRNILFGNQKRLVNGNGFIFGVPGSGKSFFAKMETCLSDNKKDDIM